METSHFNSIHQNEINYDNAQSIIRSSLSSFEKKLHLYNLKNDLEEKIKKEKERLTKEPTLKLTKTHSVILFFMIYPFLRELAVTLVLVGCLNLGINFRYFFQGPLKSEVKKAVKAYEKEIKNIERYLENIKKAEK